MDEYDEKFEINTTRHSNLSNWVSFLNLNCNIYIVPHILYVKLNLIYIFKKENAGGITRDFTGTRILTILEEVEIDKRFSKLENKDIIQKICKDFYYIGELLTTYSLQKFTQQGLTKSLKNF